MIVLFAAAMLAAAEPASAAATPTSPATTVAPAVVPAPTPVEDPAETLAAVQDMYNQSCLVKAYAAYDDLCDALRKQIREAERITDKAAADKKRKPSKSAASETK